MINGSPGFFSIKDKIMSKNVVKAIPIQSVNGSLITTSYQLFDADGLPEACFYLKILNDCDKDILISYDGTNDNDVALDNTTVNNKIEINVQQGSRPNNNVCLFPKGQKIYVKGSGGTSGTVYLIAYYQI